jgi:hypothetical protein
MQQVVPSSPSQSSPPQARSQSGRDVVFSALLLLVMIALMSGGITLGNYTDDMDKQLVNQIANQPASDPNPSAPVTCNNLPMVQNEICEHIMTFNSSGKLTSKYSYNEQKKYQHEQRIQKIKDDHAEQAKQAENNIWHIITLVLGVAVLFFGIASLIYLVRTLRLLVRYLRQRSKPQA